MPVSRLVPVVALGIASAGWIYAAEQDDLKPELPAKGEMKKSSGADSARDTNPPARTETNLLGQADTSNGEGRDQQEYTSKNIQTKINDGRKQACR